MNNWFKQQKDSQASCEISNEQKQPDEIYCQQLDHIEIKRHKTNLWTSGIQLPSYMTGFITFDHYIYFVLNPNTTVTRIANKWVQFIKEEHDYSNQAQNIIKMQIQAREGIAEIAFAIMAHPEKFDAYTLKRLRSLVRRYYKNVTPLIKLIEERLHDFGEY